MIWLLCNVAVIHELPLHIVTEAFSTIYVFKKLNCYKQRLFFSRFLLFQSVCRGSFVLVLW